MYSNVEIDHAVLGWALQGKVLFSHLDLQKLQRKRIAMSPVDITDLVVSESNVAG
jgi:hypothetical protein